MSNHLRKSTFTVENSYTQNVSKLTRFDFFSDHLQGMNNDEKALALKTSLESELSSLALRASSRYSREERKTLHARQIFSRQLLFVSI